MILQIIVIAAATYLTRVLPFLFFKDKKLPTKLLKVIDLLPYATISLLVVYCFKDLTALSIMPNLIASSICIFTYVWKRNTILSISTSTLIYMLLI